MSKKLDIKVGQRFNRLTVVEELPIYVAPNGQRKRRFRCKCDCGNYTDVMLSNLVYGGVASCGCAKADSIKVSKKKFNTYEDCGDYLIGFTSNGVSFKIDKEDFNSIKNFCWGENELNYIYTNINKRKVYLHRLITNAPDGMVVDHINHDTTDNRKCNLRVCTQQENTRNRASSGVSKRCDTNRWEAYVFMANKKIHLGYFATKEEALMARKNGEKKYYKEFAYNA